MNGNNHFKKFKEFFSIFSERIYEWASYLSILLLAVLLIGVFARYFFRHPQMWTFVVSIWIYAITWLVGGAGSLKRDEHIYVDLIYHYVSKRVANLLRKFQYIITFLATIVAAISWINIAWQSYLVDERDSTFIEFAPPIWWLKWLLIVALLLLSIQAIILLTENKAEKEV